MAMELENLEEPLRRLRKSFKGLPKDPTEDEVHKLRTSTRRMEAIVQALGLGRSKDTRRLLDSVTPVRKAAGDVRDIDVLSAKVLGLSNGDESEGLVRLTEHLCGMRMKEARALSKRVSEQGTSVRRSLRQQLRLIEKEFGRKKDGDASRPAAKAVAAGLELAEELNRWPRLNAENLHPFRIKVKELRYVLEMGAAEADSKFVEMLGEVKDKIGEWHDWVELGKIAGEVLDRRGDREVLKQIERAEERAFRQALTAANRLLRDYLGSAPGRGTRKAPRSAGVKGAVVKAAVGLAG